MCKQQNSAVARACGADYFSVPLPAVTASVTTILFIFEYIFDYEYSSRIFEYEYAFLGYSNNIRINLKIDIY